MEKIKKKRGKKKKKDEEEVKKRKEILNVRMKKLKSRFENVFKFRYKSSENDESCLQWCSCNEDEDEKWQEVCGKKRECGRSTSTFCAAIRIEEKKKSILNDSLDDFTSSSDERNNPKKENDEEKERRRRRRRKMRFGKKEYTIAVRNILFTNVSLGKPNGKHFWFRVKEHLIGLFPEIELSASEIRTQWTLRSQDKIRNPEEKKEKKKSDESIKLANKGTLKRRKQIRAKIEELEADHVDDVFGEGGIMISPPKSRKFVNIVVDSPQLPSSLDDCTSPANSSVVASPDIDLLRPVNHGAYDAYIHKRDRDFRQGRRKETKAKKKMKGTTSSQKKRRVNNTVSAMSRDLSGRTIRGCVTPSGTTKIKYQNEDDSSESFDGTNNNNSMISESDISDIALTASTLSSSSSK